MTKKPETVSLKTKDEYKKIPNEDISPKNENLQKGNRCIQYLASISGKYIVFL